MPHSATEQGGNTIPPAKATKKTASKDIKARGWCLTLNNYTDEEWNTLVDYCATVPQQYIIGKEVGEQGTPHIQGYIWKKCTLRLNTLMKLLPRGHWEVAKGTPDQNRNYCNKDNEFLEQWIDKKKSATDLLQARKDKALKKYENIEWKQWQMEIINEMNKPADDRTVYWVYDEAGGRGKSFLAKYLYLTHTTIIADGKKDNIFNQLNNKVNVEGKEPEICLLDIPRCGRAYMNYGVIEQIKNGLIYSGKYEGGDIIFDAPHIIIFANFEPDYDQFTADRWKVIDLADYQE